MRASLSISLCIMILVAGTALPFLVFSALLVDRAATNEQELIARTVRNAAMSAAADLNRQVGALQSLVIALADSRLLQTGDLAAFHAQASELVRRQDLTAVLYDSTGQELVNTSVPFGSELPVDPAATSNVAESGQAYVSDLTTDARTGKSVVNIPVPVMRDGKLAYVAGLQISNAIAAVIAEQRTLQEQTVGLVDRRGVIIYRRASPSDLSDGRFPRISLQISKGAMRDRSSRPHATGCQTTSRSVASGELAGCSRWRSRAVCCSSRSTSRCVAFSRSARAPCCLPVSSPGGSAAPSPNR